MERPTLFTVEVAPEVGCEQTVVHEALAAELAPATDVRTGWSLSVKGARDAILIELRDGAGAKVLSRLLEGHQMECDDVAEAAAIVVDRYFRTLGWASARSELGVMYPARTVLPPTPAHSVAAKSQAPLLPPRFVLSLGPVAWTRTRTIALALDARVRFLGTLSLGVSALLPSFRVDETLGPSPARADVHGYPVLARLASERRFGRFGVALGLETLLTFERGESIAIASPAVAWRTVAALGGDLEGSIALGGHVRVTALCGVYRSVFWRSYYIGGVPDAILEPPLWQAIAGVRVGWIPRW